MSAGELDRRAFVGMCAAAVLGGCSSLVVREVVPVDGRIDLALSQFPELLTSGGSVMVRPTGSSELIYVLTLEDGAFTALSPECTHRRCTVEVQGARLVCPCHGSTYDRSGRVLEGPAERPLTQYRVERPSNDQLRVYVR